MKKGIKMNFGFSYIGFLFLCMLMLPNLLWTRNKPEGYEKYVLNENKILLIFERCGEVLVSCISLIFTDFNIKQLSKWSLWLAAAAGLMILYEIWWVRYFKSRKTMKDFYSSLLGVPVAGATLPVTSFLLLSFYGKNIFLFLAVIILGIGHIGIHLEHRREIC